ncbi:MAG: hypothetical protein HC855_04740 [Rhizobiales bacterium]|nr:hypothetical protein [Hyphomicrobiales bacterium]
MQIKLPFVTETKSFSFEERDAANNTLPQISAATNATPIQITTVQAHGWITGQVIEIYGVTGNTAANGIFTITVIDANNFTLNGSVGNGAYNAGTGRIARRISTSSTLFTTTPGTPTTHPFDVWEPAQLFTRAFYRTTTGGSNSPSAAIGTTTAITDSQGVASSDAYVAGSFQRRKKFTIPESLANGDIYAWGVRGDIVSSDNAGYKVVMDPEKITKLNTHTLELSLLSKWARA